MNVVKAVKNVFSVRAKLLFVFNRARLLSRLEIFRAYAFNFLREIVFFVGILHQENVLLLSLSVIVELYDIFMLQLRVYQTLLHRLLPLKI